jgi:ATP-binding cassette, subfamily B, bacterial HlyB/CyaB
MTQTASIDTGLNGLVLIAQFFGLPADPEHLIHSHGQSGKQFSLTDIIRAGRSIGLKVRSAQSNWERLVKTPVPAMVQNVDGSYFILAGLKGDQVLLQNPLQKTPQTVSRNDFLESWTGKVILFTKRASLTNPGGQFDISWFIPALVKYKRLFHEVLAASFFLQLFALATPLFFQVVIDKVLVHHGLTTLHVLAVGLLALSLFEVVLSGLRTYLFSHTANRIDVMLGAKLFKHLMALPIAYFEARRVGDSVARVRELESIRNFLTGSALTLVIDLFFTLVFFTVLYYYSPLLTAIVAGSIPFYVALSIIVTPVLRSRLDEKFNRGAENQAFLVEAISGIQTLKAMAVEPQMQRRWEEQLAGYVSASFKASNLGNIANQAAGFISKVTTVFILWFGASSVIQGELSVGQLIAFNMISSRVTGPILRLVQLWQDFQQAGISLKRLGDILNNPTEPGYNPGRATLPLMQGAVEFDQVSFHYAADRPDILKNIQLKIAPGEVIGIVGRSGSGKSTLTKLVQRLYLPSSGRIMIDGIDLALVEPAWLRRQVGVVLQENYLFNRSIRDNIVLSNPGMSMDHVIQAAQLAGAHDFILELPEGYDTLVGEQGSNLSGGQRQRIAIARALITQPKILILDEATSALDYESESIIQNNMRAICQGRTVFIIAHRLSAVRQCDRILVVEGGQIVEQGGHQALLDQQGYYARLHAIQIGAPL